MATSSRAERADPRLARRRLASREGRTLATPYLYIAPGLLVYGAFLLWPLARAAQYSLYAWDTVSPARFVGLANYAAMVNDPDLLGSFGHSAVLIVFYAVLPICLGLVVAAILNRARVRGLSFFRTVIFLPQVIAMVVVAVAWTRIYSTDGSLNALLRLVGLPDLARAWLGDYTFALPAVGLIGTWVETGLVTILLLAGMGRVPRDLYEAARLDGAGAVAEFFAITLPAVRGELVVAATLTVVAALKNFDIIYMTTRGGPGTSTTVPSYQVYNQAFGLGQVGMATTIGVSLAVLIFGINLILNRLGDRAAADS
ncbi:carbohydrate ABC transporter permease [Propionicimonas sp.]|uniref:carbohydrate ABC transporter permease n=1 Tax=Propionicimonas sp. TaxID=1955623 RepID=UPI0039E52710